MKNNQTQKSISVGWQVKKLGDVTSLLKDGSHGTHMDVIDGVPLLSAKDLKMGRVEIDNNPRLIAIEDFNQIHKNYKIKNGDILVSLVGSIGKVALVDNYNDNYTLQRSVGILRFEKDNNLFLYHFFNTKYFQNQLLVKENKGAQGGVYLGSLSKIKLNLPPLPEQNRIVSVLETWDKVIEKLAKKIEFKKNIKKGLMQRLLTGELRLPGFNEVWTEIKLGNIGQVRTSSVDKKTVKNQKEVFLLNYMDVYRRDKIFIKDKFQKITAQDQQIESSNLMRGDVLFTPSSETQDDIGHSAVVMEDLPNILFSYHLIRFRPKNKNLLPEYLAYAFKGHDFYKSLWKKSQGATRYTLAKKDIEDSKIFYPSSTGEQLAIASILDNANNEIELLNTKLKFIKEQKNYLLNNLITGAIRTPETMKIKS